VFSQQIGSEECSAGRWPEMNAEQRSATRFMKTPQTQIFQLHCETTKPSDALKPCQSAGISSIQQHSMPHMLPSNPTSKMFAGPSQCGAGVFADPITAEWFPASITTLRLLLMGRPLFQCRRHNEIAASLKYLDAWLTLYVEGLGFWPRPSCERLQPTIRLYFHVIVVTDLSELKT
jgi:hypothetical protein